MLKKGKNPFEGNFVFIIAIMGHWFTLASMIMWTKPNGHFI
jgi:hypothetical protein